MSKRGKSLGGSPRGMVTIATGDKHYYQIAANLLLSYRTFSDNPLPFAIIAEEENEYTALFDDVIITNEAMRSFTDKFLLLKLCPYDESIFFDADCLAYGDLNKYWDCFEGATDFSILGINCGLEDNNGAWYNLDGIGKYASLIQYKTRVHSGVIFIRQSNLLEKMYDDCIQLFRDFSSLTFHTCPSSVDECIIGIAMPMNNMKAIDEKPNMIAAYPCLTKLKANIYRRQLEYSTPWHAYLKDGILLHWGTAQTKQPLYLFNVEGLKCLNYESKSFWNTIWYKYGLRKIMLIIKDYKYLLFFIKNKLHKIKIHLTGK